VEEGGEVYHLVEKERDEHIGFRVRASSTEFEFEFKSQPHALCEVALPAFFPRVHLGQSADINAAIREPNSSFRDCHIEMELC
jgi:hypothetical protein